MCGFVGVAGPGREQLVERLLPLLAHRGPDGSGVTAAGDYALGHRRLAIMDLEGGAQPMADPGSGECIVHSGEVYNHLAMRKQLSGNTFRTKSDAETILRLAASDLDPGEWLPQLEGMFAFAISGPSGLFMARDALGIKPLYVGRRGDHALFSSEIRPLLDAAEDIWEFPPGSYLRTGQGLKRYRKTPDLDATPMAAHEARRELLQRLIGSVRASLTSDVPVGALLSGGVDSSIIVAIAARFVRKMPTFSVGMEGSPDLLHARAVAEMLGTRHRERVYTFEEAVDALPEVIGRLESFDCALVRTAIPYYLLARLASEHVKVVLAGEGADELFGGYDYLRPMDPQALDTELRQITLSMHNTNLQRCDRMGMAHGLEVRVPFLDDPALVEFAMRLRPELKLAGKSRTGKWVLRNAALAFLPLEIVGRPKARLADGSGLGERMSRYAAERITDREFSSERKIEEGFTLRSKEELLYYRIFRESFPSDRMIRLIGRSRGA